ncbi:hypothetical protein SAMN04489730_6429 [Amycolatopsis australiensis]|uniref:Uncharacterized protein n=1 Tax=Amycolatopsis australiensis TaxID=546364 RepID=A0A1K1SQT9_9PSEU|nr:hypothetical protein SAMN04489730_6429 [Amycolatopsis australiensis]
MLRKVVTGFGVALAMFVGMVSTSGLAQAAPNDGSVPPVPGGGTWVYVRWYEGHTMESYARCSDDGAHLYPGRLYQCRQADNPATTQLWVLY